MNYKDQVDDYLNGRLDDIARKRFEYALGQSEALADEVERAKNASIKLAADSIIPSKLHIIKTVLLALVLGVGGVLLTKFFQTNTPKVSRTLPFEEIYIKPEWPRSGNNRGVANYSHLIKAYLKGDKTALDTLSSQSRGSAAPKIKYWTAELFFASQEIDSMLVYLPERFDTKHQDRVHYLRIMGYYYLGEYDLVKQAIKDLPTETNKRYLMVYNKIIAK